MPTDILLLQGPVGPFFSRLAQEFAQYGHRVYKINLNAGDRYFFNHPQAVDYTGTVEAWPEYLAQVIERLGIDRIYVFGDCRVYHELAREVAREKDVRFFVFEEGYLRPDYVTLEEGGVNGYSPLDFSRFDSVVSLREAASPQHVFRHGFALSAWYAMQYYVAASWGRRSFPHYRHHRPLNVWSEGSKWLLSFWRKARYWRRDRAVERRLRADFSGRYFFVPLQVHVDMQVVRHSPFGTVEAFIETVVESFVRHAPDDTVLLIKHHPMDRGYRDYTDRIARLAKKLGADGRIHYVFDGHLPTLLKHARGTVTINSTVGLSSLHHGTPVKVLGRAIYDQPGLTAAAPLDEFWHHPGAVDRKKYHLFRHCLMASNQLNGNFYQRAKDAPNPTGLVWPAALAQQHGSGRPANWRSSSTGPRLVKGSAA